jgi:sugar phosphate isomerase/epimerase
MILYGTGDPIEALEILGRKLITVHCKDGDWPEAGVPGALGKECALGAGSVGIGRFLAKLRAVGYSGPLSIEREASDPVRRMNDIQAAIALLAELKDEVF